MTQAIEEYTTTLNDLIQICIDGQKGFETAANALENSDLRSELMGFSSQRAEFAHDLQRLVAATGEKPKGSGTVEGALHRGWLNLKQAITSQDSHAILAECERGEDAAVAAYKTAMQEAMPPKLAIPVASQFRVIQNTHDRVKTLRDSLKKA
jgi:uncharacterized protein (TIGR02284 family)